MSAVITSVRIRRALRGVSHPLVTVAVGFFVMGTVLIVATVAH